MTKKKKNLMACIDIINYKIDYDEEKMKFIMNGDSEDFVSAHFIKIAKNHSIKEIENSCSESHMLAILEDNGINIEIQKDW